MARKGVNRMTLVGNLGQDPEVRATQSGTRVANISVATSESWKDKNTGQPVEHTEWHRVVFFNKLAEIVEQYLTKGSQVYIEGRLRTRKWQDKNGQDKWTTEIVATEMQMMGSRNSGANNNDAPAAHAPADPSPAPTTPGPDIAFDDDIPF